MADDIIKAHEVLVKFLDMEYEAERFDEAHLLPIALEITGEPELPLTVQYVSMPKSKNNDTPVLGRRMTFSSFYSFLMTDFYEGLHHGHYLRQCPICKQYFLMESARWQVYTDACQPAPNRHFIPASTLRGGVVVASIFCEYPQTLPGAIPETPSCHHNE